MSFRADSNKTGFRFPFVQTNMSDRGRERTAAGLWTVGRRWAGEGGGDEGGLSPYFNSNLKRLLATKHLLCSSPNPIHITPVLLHP